MTEETSSNKNIPSPKKFSVNKVFLYFLAGSVVGICGVVWFFYFFPYVSTDDARIAGTLVRIAPENVSGKIIKLNVQEGDFVKKGAILLELEHNLYEAQLAEAKARQAFASKELGRIRRVVEQHGIALKELDSATSTSQIADAELSAAMINYERTFIKSPIDGQIVQKTIEVGDVLEPNQIALTVADTKNVWVAANIEETSIGNVKVGQPVTISVDSGGVLMGKVLEIRRATQAQFALIQTDNPAGNFTKLVQRIPIKIAISEDSNAYIGQSVEIKIRVRE